MLRKGRFALRAALFLCPLALALAQPDRLAELSTRGKQLMSDGRFAEASTVYAEMVKVMPANPGLHLNLGLALQMSGHPDQAIPEFERVLKSDPSNYPALLSLGMSRLQTNNPAAAVAPLQKVVALQPSSADPRGMLANALLALNRAAEAAVHFRKLTQLNPNDAKAWFGLGRSHEALALQSFQDLAKTAEGSGEWLTLVAESRAARGQLRSAFYFYRQALEKAPKLRGVHAALASVYRATDHPDWAEQEEKAEAAMPTPNCVLDTPACDFKAGRLLEAASAKSAYWRTKANNELARQAFRQLAKLPASVELHALLAETLRGHSQFQEAVNEWRAALKMEPNDPRLHRELATALYQAQDYQGALPMLEEELKSEPASLDLNFFAGDSYLRLEQPLKALPYLETATKLDPKFEPAHASLGLALMRLEQPAAAAPHLVKALGSDEDGSLHYQLSRAYQASGETDKARQALAKYQEIQQASEAAKRDLEEKVKITAP